MLDSADGTARPWVHDIRGNVTDNGQVAITYDFAGQPLAIAKGAVTQFHRYDGHKKRVRTIEGSKTTYWVYSTLTGTPVYQEEVQSGASTGTHYVAVPGANVRLKAGDLTYTHLDHQGSPVVATAGLMGGELWRERYTPFGEKHLSAAANDNDMGYTGHIQDSLSGLTYMQARYYDPIAGRFLSTDPIGYQDQLNLYAYVRNEPIGNYDPNGLCTGSRITNDDGTCKSTGGNTTDIGGVMQGMAKDRALAKAATAVSKTRARGNSNTVNSASGHNANCAHTGSDDLCYVGNNQISGALEPRYPSNHGKSRNSAQIAVNGGAGIAISAKSTYIPNGPNLSNYIMPTGIPILALDLAAGAITGGLNDAASMRDKGGISSVLILKLSKTDNSGSLSFAINMTRGAFESGTVRVPNGIYNVDSEAYFFESGIITFQVSSSAPF